MSRRLKNIEALSRIIAGTGALKSSFTRHGKMSFAGAIADARKSATRIYINNFTDKGRQNTIDMLLVNDQKFCNQADADILQGRLMDQSPVHLFDPITDYVSAELKRRYVLNASPRPHDPNRILGSTSTLNLIACKYGLGPLT